jgi:fumarylacetoacetase
MSRLVSWVGSAHDTDTDFPMENLPFCIFRPSGSAQSWRIGVGIGSKILDLHQLADAGLLKTLSASIVKACRDVVLNEIFSLGSGAVRELRMELQSLLADGAADRQGTEQCLLNQSEADYALPMRIGDYSDFLSSFHHAYNVGMMLRPNEPVLPNFHTIPIAYHGRSSSLLVSGDPVYRPRGVQRVSHGSNETRFGPTRRLDFEVELGAFIGPGNQRGFPIPVDEASEQVIGLCVLNDWSARDIQSWETQPLGPFLGKNFASTLAPWIVCTDALDAYKVPSALRGAGAPPLQPYLQTTGDSWTYEIHLETHLSTEKMRGLGLPAVRISKSLFSRDSIWTFAQMVAHHTVNGCNLRTGDLLGSGTLSGPDEGSEGCMLELTRGGTRQLSLPSGELRSFLEDGDEVSITAFCERSGLPRIGFGRCVARIEAAPCHTK